MKHKAELFLIFLATMTIINFVVVVLLGMNNGSLRTENAILKAIPVSQECDNLVIVIPKEQLEQCKYNMDKGVYLYLKEMK